MIIMTVTFESGLAQQDAYSTAEERLPQFREVPGLLQKFYVKRNEPSTYSGIYIWDSIESMKNFRESELAATIPAAYQVKGKPQVDVSEVFTTLRSV